MGQAINESKRRLAMIVAQEEPLEASFQEELAQLAPLAVGQGLGPMLFWVIHRYGVQMALPEVDILERSAQEAAAHYAILAAEQKRLEATLKGAGIPALWLKGIALAGAVYPDPWCRPMEDLDVLVPCEQRVPAVRVVEDLGYQRTEADYLAMVGAPEIVRNHDLLRGGPGGAVTLEVHFRLLGISGSSLLPPEQLARFWEQTQPLEAPGLVGMTLRPESHLLYLCAHALLQHGEAYLNLLRLLDLHLLATKNKMDWMQVVQGARELGWTFATSRALRLAGEFFGTPVPEEVHRALESGRGLEASQETAARLQQRTGRWEEWRVLFNKQSRAQRLRLVWVTLFPPQAYIRDLYSLPPGRQSFPYYLLRWMDGWQEVARSLVAGWKLGRNQGKERNQK